MPESNFRPMLPCLARNETLRYPFFASAPQTGLRCIIHNGRALGRTMKPISDHSSTIASSISRHDLEGFDGFLQGPEGVPCFYVFDVAYVLDMPYSARYSLMVQRWAALPENIRDIVKPHPHAIIRDEAELLRYEQLIRDQDYTRIMIRDPHGPYKHGLATEKEGWFMALDFPSSLV